MAFLSISRLVLHGLWLVPFHLTLTSAQENPSAPTCPPKDAFNWESISPSESVNWTSCYDTNLCVRLKVPFDYTNPQGDEFAIALLKIPANISTSDPAYRGSILINPGGPGGSGVDLALQLGSLVQTLIGADYDVIGFDPRGVGRTTPGIDAFRGAELQRQVWGIRSLDIPTVDDSPEALPRAVAIQSLNSKLLADKAADIAPYVGTAAVAHDMLSIVEALGQEKLQYWGISYGSVLGTTFASLFPDKVGRLIVDGVVDGNEWYKGNNTGAVRDTDSIINIVAGECATTTECPLHEATTEAVEKRFFNIFESLRTKIVTLYDGVERIAYIDRKLALSSLWTSLYFPYALMAPLFEALSDLEKGDGLKFYNYVGNFTGNFTVTCQQCHPLTVDDAGASPDADTSIQCADSGPIPDNLSFLKGLYNAISDQTYLADIPFYFAIRCVGWSLESKSRFEGTLGGDTSFPLLFIGNTHDPITPLQNAFTMSPLFKGSAVLTRDAIGHTSLSGVSPCTYQAVRDYFRDGVLPSPGTVCDDIADALFGNQTTTTRKRGLGGGGFEEQMLEAAAVLSMTRFSYRFGVSVW